MKARIASALAALTSGHVFAVAAAPQPLPEPGSFELIAIAGVIAVVVAIRNRRK